MSILTWATWEGSWDSQDQPWGTQVIVPPDPDPDPGDPDTSTPVVTASGDMLVGIVNNSKLMVLDPGVIDGDINTVIERVGLPMLDGHIGVTSITRVYPHVVGTELLRFTFGSQDFAGSPIRWKPPIDFDPKTQRKIDVRTTGELHCWRVESVGNGQWRFSGFDVEFTQNGVR